MRDPHSENLLKGLNSHPHNSPVRFHPIEGQTLYLPFRMPNPQDVIDITFDLRDCEEMGHIPVEVTNSLPVLTTLTIKSKTLRRLHPTITNFKGLKHLYLECRRLEELPENIGSLTRLEFLKSPPLKSYPESFGKLVSLKKLIIHPYFDPGVDPYLVVPEFKYIIPGLFGSRINLQELDLSHTPIKEFVPDFKCPPNLRVMLLDNCKIKKFPEQLLTFHGTTIDLHNNYIKHIPDGISKLPYLKELSLESNQLSSMPEDLLRFSHRNYDSISISLKYNPLCKIAPTDILLDKFPDPEHFPLIQFIYRMKFHLMRDITEALNKSFPPEMGEQHYLKFNEPIWETFPPDWIYEEGFNIELLNAASYVLGGTYWGIIRIWKNYSDLLDICNKVNNTASFDFIKELYKRFPKINTDHDNINLFL